MKSARTPAARSSLLAPFRGGGVRCEAHMPATRRSPDYCGRREEEGGGGGHSRDCWIAGQVEREEGRPAE